MAAQGTSSAHAKKPAPRGKATALLISCDIACNWTLDDQEEPPIAAGKSTRLSIQPGEHVLIATSDDGKDQIRKEFQAEAGEEADFDLRLLRVRIERLKKDLADQQERIKKFKAGVVDNPPEPDQSADQQPAPQPAQQPTPAPPQPEPAQQTIPTPPPPEPAHPGKLEISSTVASEMLIAGARPAYPPLARATGISGSVVLHGTITRDGSVTDLAVVSGPDLLQKPAIDAVSTWKYAPYVVNGQPVDVNTTFTIDFKLNAKERAAQAAPPAEPPQQTHQEPAPPPASAPSVELPAQPVVPTPAPAAAPASPEQAAQAANPPSAPAAAPASPEQTAQPANPNPAPLPEPESQSKPEISPETANKLVVSRVLPVYPQAARTLGVTGTVVLHFTITRDGLVTDLRVVSGPALLQKPALDSVTTWKFWPYKVNGHAVDATTTYAIEFKLADAVPADKQDPAPPK